MREKSNNQTEQNNLLNHTDITASCADTSQNVINDQSLSINLPNLQQDNSQNYIVIE